MRKEHRVKWHIRAVACLMVLLELGVGLPVPLLAQTTGGSPEASPTPAPTPAPEQIQVATGEPDTQLITPQLQFSRQPADADITMARVFEEPLVPAGGSDPSSGAENQALANALMAFKSRTSAEDFSGLTGFIDSYPQSSWRASLQLELGLLYRQSGYFTQALASLADAWALSKGETEAQGAAMADRAVGELLDLDARCGRMEQMQGLFEELAERNMQGPGAVKLTMARESYWMMTHKPGQAFRCGPFALNSILNIGGNPSALNPRIDREPSTAEGTSLEQLRKLSAKVGLNYQAAYRTGGAEWIVPCVVQWKIGHFGAITQKGKDGRYLVQDPILKGPMWITAQALESEASGYALVPGGTLPQGWAAVSEEQAGKVWGKGNPTQGNEDEKTAFNSMAGGDGNGGASGMAGYSIYKMLGTLAISLTPVKYQPPIGPAIGFSIGYHYLENGQPANFNFANTGVFWTNNWTSYLVVDSSNNVSVTCRGGGTEKYYFTTLDKITGQYAPQLISHAIIKKTGDKIYQRILPDGSTEVYSQVDGTGRIFLKSVADPQGNTVTLTYDGSFRLTTITDAIGQQTAIHYSSGYTIDKVSDPFGRQAVFSYDSNNNLTSVTANSGATDGTEIVSQFEYKESNFVTKMTTPYGATYFYQYVPAEDGTGRGLWVVRPDGSKQALERYFGTSMMTYYWDQQVMASAGAVRNSAYQTRWMVNTFEGVTMMEDVPKWTKAPLEGMVVYRFDGESTPLDTGTGAGTIAATPDEIEQAPEGIPYTVGKLNTPISICRELDDGSLQTCHYTYNAVGSIIQSVDPLGRTFSYHYAANNIDMLEIRQTQGTNNDLLAKSTYNSQHLPLTVTDASGRTTTNVYNDKGQLTSVTNARGETVRYVYDTNRRLAQVDGPVSGNKDVTNFTYDGYGRPLTTTSVQGPNASDRYMLTYAYDTLDRVTQVTYPDGTKEQSFYYLLNLQKQIDPLGRMTQFVCDAMGRTVKSYDPEGRLTQSGYNQGGLAETLTDQKGQVTKWSYDVQGRPLSKIFANGSHYDSVYENTTSQVKSTTDARGTVTDYTYKRDGSINTVSYSPGSGVPDTSDITYTYDANYPRISTVTNGYGTYTCNYNGYANDFYGSPDNGRGKPSSMENSALGSTATISCAYDELGRVIAGQINGSANESTVSFDAAGRVISTTNALGTFTPAYQNANYGVSRVTSVSCPNGMTVNYDWESSQKDFQLKQISNKDKNNAVISKFDYVTDAVGRIKQWKQQTGSNTPVSYAVGYDQTDQVVSAALTDTSTSALLKRYNYSYDPAGNRLGEQIDTTTRGATFNSLNQLTETTAGGSTRVRGILDKPGTVKINGSDATMVGSGTSFYGDVNLTTGTNTLTVMATTSGTSSPTSRTNSYQVIIPSGSSRTLTYDANGNMTNDGANTSFTWDAANRLVKITYADDSSKSSNFTYDALGQRVRIIEITSSGTSTKNFIWNGGEIAEQRDGSNTVIRQYFGGGYRDVVNGANYYYTTDHLGNIREVVGSDGETVAARYDYDLYGRMTKVSGSQDSDFLYTGYHYHAPSNLYLAPYRAYDSNLGRFISRDPIAEAGGLNLYGYCGNNPVCSTDPLGLSDGSFSAGGGSVGGGIAWGASGAGSSAFGAGGLAGVAANGLLTGLYYLLAGGSSSSGSSSGGSNSGSNGGSSSSSYRAPAAPPKPQPIPIVFKANVAAAATQGVNNGNNIKSYGDINHSFMNPYGVGYTIGAFFDKTGVYFYLGPAIGSPGPSFSITAAGNGSISPGQWSSQLQLCSIIAFSKGKSGGRGFGGTGSGSSRFWEVGAGVPGASYSTYYTFRRFTFFGLWKEGN